MKALNVILKILTALAAVAGVIYVIAAYGDDIVSWAKSFIKQPEADSPAEVIEEAVSEETPVESVEAAVPSEAEALTETAPSEDAAVLESTPVADESDFEG